MVEAEEEERRAKSEREPALELPDELPILPLKDTVVYPFAMIPLGVGKDRSIRLIDDVMRGSRMVGLVAQKDDPSRTRGRMTAIASAP